MIKKAPASLTGEKPWIHVALPALGEAAYLPKTLDCLRGQTHARFRIWVCVNQPESWWDEPHGLRWCINNAESLRYLHSLDMPGLHILDRSSRGKGWSGRQAGVGWARKWTMDRINEVAAGDDVLVSMDADTHYPPDYLDSIEASFDCHPDAVALANPYRHPLSGDEQLDRALLRYEIYMRYYAINLWRIGSPYSFTALGSAMACPIRSYRKVGGLSPKTAGEDFYFLQKLRKSGWILQYNRVKVLPSGRQSERVAFGTGPALRKGMRGDWAAYPLYPHPLFDQIAETYSLFPTLYEQEVETPLTSFFQAHMGGDVFGPLRRNAASREAFVRACHQKLDGLRIRQFLKRSHLQEGGADEMHLMVFLQAYHPDRLGMLEQIDAEPLDFSTVSMDMLDKIRNLMISIEEAYQLQDVRQKRKHT